MLAVARRWFDTPAGRQAALIAALTALETDQPAVASAWLERLASTRGADRLEPTLTAMRAIARHRSGDPRGAEAILQERRAAGSFRVGGRDVALSPTLDKSLPWLGAVAGAAAAGVEWRQGRGDPARNALATASRPLLAPRYRVPLARHPEEARLLELRRRSSADRGLPLMPAGAPLAVDGLVITRTPLGILAVDFATGKRLWLQTGTVVAADRAGDDGDEEHQADEAARDGLGRVFDDATAAGLTAVGGLVFAVECPADAAATFGHTQQLGMARRGGDAVVGNTLVACELAGRGAVRWRSPASKSTTWYLGAPLAVGGELYVLAEEKGEIRLDVLDAAQGSVVWSQPLAELEADESVTHAAARDRRRAGLAPALADGVLVCPLGAGAVVAIDLATRTLLWAFRYDHVRAGGQPAAPGRLQAGPEAGGEGRSGRPRDSLPVIVGGRVLLTPYDSEELICLDLREGTPAWRVHVPGGQMLAGVVGDRVIVIAGRTVDAVSLATGRRLWSLPLDREGGRPCGRGILTSQSFFLPLDTPEILEIGIADGAVTGRCPARGGIVPGNLIAYRGEMISRGLDSLDVFHQAAPLESRIRTALQENPASPWARQWSGQLALEAGRVAEGLGELMQAAQAPDSPLAPEIMADAVIFGMQRDFAAVAPLWRDALRSTTPDRGDPSLVMRTAIRAATDGFLRNGDFDAAWAAVQELLFGGPPAAATDLVRDSADPSLAVSEERWLRGRVAEIFARAPAALRAEMENAEAEAVAAAAADRDAGVRLARLERLADRLGARRAAGQARELVVAELDAVVARGDPEGRLTRNRDFQRLALLQSRESEPAVRGGDGRLAAQGGPGSTLPSDVAWPLGRVVPRRPRGAEESADQEVRERHVTHPVATDAFSLHAHLSIACDEHQGRLLVLDGYGRPIVEPLVMDHAARRLGLPWAPRESECEASLVGRVLFVRVGDSMTAYDLAGRGDRRLWTRGPGSGSRRELPVAAWSRAVGGRAARHGDVPLGLDISEPDGVARRPTLHGARGRVAGVLRAEGGSLALIDPLSGATLWERNNVKDVAELFGDEEFVCLCTTNGRESSVLSMDDGRIVRTFVAPHARQRLGGCGRRFVAVRPLAVESAGTVAASVQLELVDPVSLDVTPLGEVSGEARAVMAADDRLVVLTPAGDLTAFDLRHGGVAFRSRLPEMPASFDRLHVVPWEDRYLVMAGGRRWSRPAAGALPAFGDHEFGEGRPGAGDGRPPESGAVWAVDRSTGELIWPAPATIEHHWVHTNQPAGLPILLLTRQILPRGEHDQPRLSVVALDKRTGHAVFTEDGLPVQPDMAHGCELAGDPVGHTITVQEFGAIPWRIMLDFTGQPIAPQPPYKAGRERLLEQLRPADRSRP